MAFATGHTSYELFDFTCYSSLCTSLTGVTSATSPIPFSGLLATFTSPYFTNSQTLNHSVVGSWQVPAWTTEFNFVISGFLAITGSNNAVTEYPVFEFTFTTMKTEENPNEMTYILASPESGAVTTLTMSYVLTRQLIENTFIELNFPPYNYKGLDDVSINPVYSHID